MNIQLDLDFYFRQLASLADKQNRPWKEVRDRSLQAKIAINKALGIGNVYSRWINRILCDVCLQDEESVDPAITLRLVNLVDAAIRAHEALLEST